MTTIDAVERAVHLSAAQYPQPKKTISPQQAHEQLWRWNSEDIALGMIYARANHHSSVWARVTIGAPTASHIICESENMHFMLSIHNATFTIESLQSWNQSMPLSDRSAIEGLQIWCEDGDWLFLTEQIAQSRTLSLTNPFKS